MALPIQTREGTDQIDSTHSSMDAKTDCHIIFSEEEIAVVAYDIWEKEGRPWGRDEAHWRVAVERLRARQIIVTRTDLHPDGYSSSHPQSTTLLTEQVGMIEPRLAKDLGALATVLVANLRSKSKRMVRFLTSKGQPTEKGSQPLMAFS
jgi:hypothetical protein